MHLLHLLHVLHVLHVLHLLLVLWVRAHHGRGGVGGRVAPIGVRVSGIGLRVARLRICWRCGLQWLHTRTRRHWCLCWHVRMREWVGKHVLLWLRCVHMLRVWLLCRSVSAVLLLLCRRGLRCSRRSGGCSRRGAR